MQETMLSLSPLNKAGIPISGLPRVPVLQTQDSLGVVNSLPSPDHLQLVGMSDSCTGLAALPALQQLDLLCHSQTGNLASCPQVTKLNLLSKPHPGIQKISFLNNGAIQLQRLQLDNRILQFDWEFSLNNLGSATQLTYLAVIYCCPSDTFWPNALLQHQELAYLIMSSCWNSWTSPPELLKQATTCLYLCKTVFRNLV